MSKHNKYKKPNKRLLDTIKGEKVKNGAYPLKEFREKLYPYGVNDFEFYRIDDLPRLFLRRFAARILYHRYMLSKKQYLDILKNNFGRIKYDEVLDAFKF